MLRHVLPLRIPLHLPLLRILVSGRSPYRSRLPLACLPVLALPTCGSYLPAYLCTVLLRALTDELWFFAVPAYCYCMLVRTACIRP